MNATEIKNCPSSYFECIILREISVMKYIMAGIKKVQGIKVDPHFVLLFLVIMFVVLLFAAENVVKTTLIPQ